MIDPAVDGSRRRHGNVNRHGNLDFVHDLTNLRWISMFDHYHLRLWRDKRVRLTVDRRFRNKADEQSSQVTLVAASGASFDVLDAKLTVKVQ